MQEYQDWQNKVSRKWEKVDWNIFTGTRKRNIISFTGEFLFSRAILVQCQRFHLILPVELTPRWKRVTFLLSGIGIFQIGDQIVEVDANKDPTLIIIPGNTPHQILNEKDEPLMFFYYFPGLHI